MRTRAAAGLLVVAVAAGVSGHFLGGHAAAARPITPPAPTLSVPLQQELAAPPASSSHILWFYIHGRWRAVPG